MGLEVRGLHSFYGRAHILADVSLEAAGGEVVALLGRNGAGKSTTLKSIIGIVRPRVGQREMVPAPSRAPGAAPPSTGNSRSPLAAPSPPCPATR